MQIARMIAGIAFSGRITNADAALKEHNCYYLTAPMPKVSNGVDLVTTANELGHANATTTAMIYAHQIAIAKARAADVRAGVFAGRDSKPKGSKLRSKFRGA